MPFGSFNAQKKEQKIKPEKNREKKLRDISRPQKDKTKTKPQKQLKEEKPQYHDYVSDSTKLHIIFFGRNLWSMQDFLCSVNENMSKSLHKEGLTYFAAENDDIRDIVDRKTKLENFFWEFSRLPWNGDEESGLFRDYRFSISASGDQEKTLDLIFHCCVYGETAPFALAQADAVWFLADGPVLDEKIGYDPWRTYIKDTLSNDSLNGKIVCILMSQIENRGHFNRIGEQTELKKEVSEKLIQRVREIFTVGSVQAAVIPVQVYGGLQYMGTDDNCEPELYLSHGGFIQSYVPENCEVPNLYTVQQIIKKRRQDSLAGSFYDKINKAISQHFKQRSGVVDWSPDMVEEKEKDE